MPGKTNDDVENSIVLLYNDGYGVMELSQKYGIHRSTIQRILQRNSVRLRKRTPSYYNVHFFDDYNPNSCYWAGFIAADGYVRSDRDTVTIHLSVTDQEHLKKLKQLTDYNGNIHVSKDACSISFAGPWYKQSLAKNFDIYPQKTFNIQLSAKIPNNMISHFLRGYFDGDGCVTKFKDYLRVMFTSGSDRLLAQITEYMYDQGIRVRNNTKKAKQINYSITYNCSNAIQVLEILYRDSLYINRLDRKYQIYLEYMSTIDKEIPIFSQNRGYIESVLTPKET